MPERYALMLSVTCGNINKILSAVSCPCLSAGERERDRIVKKALLVWCAHYKLSCDGPQFPVVGNSRAPLDLKRSYSAATEQCGASELWQACFLR